MKSRKVEGRVFNLAVKKQVGERTQNLQNRHNLQTITQIPENKSSQQITNHGRSKNIFEEQKCYHQNMLTEEKYNQYNILCKKQFDAYNSKLRKIKSIAIAGILRLKVSQSFLSSCKNTGTFGELPPSNGLLKEQLHEFYVKLKNNQAQGKKKQKQCLISQSERFNQSIPSSIHKKHEKYKNAWQILSCSTDRLRSNINNSKLNSWSRGNTLQNHRKKIEQLTNLTIKNEKQNIKPISWVDNLRNPEPLNLLLKDKYIESVERQGIKMKGQNKLEKEYHWINEKKINLFDPIENKDKFTGKLEKTSQKQKQKQKQKKGLGLILQNLQNQSRRITLTNAQ